MSLLALLQVCKPWCLFGRHTLSPGKQRGQITCERCTAGVRAAEPCTLPPSPRKGPLQSQQDFYHPKSKDASRLSAAPASCHTHQPRPTMRRRSSTRGRASHVSRIPSNTHSILDHSVRNTGCRTLAEAAHRPSTSLMISRTRQPRRIPRRRPVRWQAPTRRRRLVLCLPRRARTCGGRRAAVVCEQRSGRREAVCLSVGRGGGRPCSRCVSRGLAVPCAAARARARRHAVVTHPYQAVPAPATSAWRGMECRGGRAPWGAVLNDRQQVQPARRALGGPSVLRDLRLWTADAEAHGLPHIGAHSAPPVRVVPKLILFTFGLADSGP
ncbi:hypothetical protein PsYK624_100550 [Phanerochaete sordida]|uniref:Uncharacterized protein n=1 Tax=Phanerochaete sordida TaxID=48140 RepID=A0A9P3GFG4_9APHY|nr:hypothetical protein PsYK624_100550 [Phanerochaete sordida]